MNASQEVLNLLGEWRLLTEGESRAIASENWTLVAEHQRGKEQLCVAISGALEAARQAGAGPETAGEPQERQFAALVAELKEMELRNQELLREKKQRNRAEWVRLNRTNVNLRGARRAYLGSSAPLWHSYS